MIDAYIFYMLVKQDEQIQPDLSRARRSQASTLTDKCSGLVENRYEEMQLPALLTLQFVPLTVFKRIYKVLS